MGWTDAFEEYLASKGGASTGYVQNLGKESGVKVNPVYLKGIPAEKILEYAEENDIDLIVMGTQGLTGIKRFLIGSVAKMCSGTQSSCNDRAVIKKAVFVVIYGGVQSPDVQ